MSANYIRETEETNVEGVPVQTVRTTQEVAEGPPLEPQSPQQSYRKKKVLFRAYQVIWYILGVVEVLLAFRVLLLLLGANPRSGFTSFIYALSGPFAIPFAGILRSSVTGGSVMEWSTLIGMIVYALIAYGLVKLFQLVKPTTPEEVEREVENQ
jgi:hypothetical protein